jgi:type II secretory pathway pseudopilin PulG
MSLMDRRSFTLLELIIACLVIFTLIGTFAIYANRLLAVARQQALQNELAAIRMAIEHFRIVYNKYPESLVQLVNKELTRASPVAIIPPNIFLKSYRLDKEGFLLDPFLNRYQYNKNSGQVNSTTEGLEGW